MRSIIYLFILATFISNGLASDLGVTCNVEDCEIVFYDKENKEFQLGKTPLRTNDIKVVSGSRISAKAPGHIPSEIIFYGNPKKIIQVKMDLKPLNAEDLRVTKETADSIVDRIMYIQKLLDDNRFIDVGIKLEELERQAPLSSAVKILRANYLYSTGKKESAIDLYRNLLKSIPSEQIELRESISLVLKKIDRGAK